MTDMESTTRQTPTCYRHPARETWVSCGRCGKPLCPDCMVHGPVGIRCRECLLPQGQGSGLVDTSKLSTTLLIAGGITLGMSVLLVLVGIPWISFAIGPNLLLSGLVGGLVGWVIRKRSGSWNRLTLLWALSLAALAPLLAAVVLTVYAGIQFQLFPPAILLFDIRVLAAIGASLLMSWLLATNTT